MAILRLHATSFDVMFVSYASGGYVASPSQPGLPCPPVTWPFSIR